MDMHQRIQIDFESLVQCYNEWSPQEQELIENLLFRTTIQRAIYKLRQQVGLDPRTGKTPEGASIDFKKLQELVDTKVKKKFGFPEWFLPAIHTFVRTGKVFLLNEKELSSKDLKKWINVYNHSAKEGDLMVEYVFGGVASMSHLSQRIFRCGDTTLKYDLSRDKVVLEQGVHGHAKELDALCKLMKAMTKALRQRRENIIGKDGLEGHSFLLDVFIHMAFEEGHEKPEAVRRFIENQFDENPTLPRLSQLDQWEIGTFRKRVNRAKNNFR